MRNARVFRTPHLGRTVVVELIAGRWILAAAGLFFSPGNVHAAQAPVLEFPEPGLDDPAAYQGYATRFFRDSHGNAFQVYVDARNGRIVHLWADAANESAGLTVRDTTGRPAPVTWGSAGADVDSSGGARTMRHRLASNLGALEVGWFLLGSMRQERDFQYADAHRRPYGSPPFVLGELTGLIESMERLPPAERARHIALLNARDIAELRARLEPRITLTQDDAAWTVRVEHTSLDGRNHLTLALRGATRASSVRIADRVVSMRARSLGGIEFDVTVTTDAPALTPLTRDVIFNEQFDAFYERQRSAYDSLRSALGAATDPRDTRLHAFRRLEREVRALELLSAEEKLMAGLPNFATYFGRDMMMAALMLEPIASVDLQEHVIATVLRKLSPTGQVSHEEALGGQAIREAAVEYSTLIRQWQETNQRAPAAAARHLEQARELLANLQAVRENYRMIDDDFQLPVLAGRYLSRSDVPAERKRGFLNAPGPDGAPRLHALLRNLALAAELARPYAEQPIVTNLVGFLHRDDEGWIPGSWRDSRAGYGNGRFAMDVNVVWVPRALQGIREILDGLNALGVATEDVVPRAQTDATALMTFLRDPATLSSAIATWRGARRHFEIRLEPDWIRRQVTATLEDMPDPERSFWRRRLEETRAGARPLPFLALALDSDGRPIPVANTDPATDLFLEDYTARILGGTADPNDVVQMLDVFTRAYPVGLFVDSLGPLVANDAYASAAVRDRFENDAYHSPRVVWGREVNLLLLGLARQIQAAYDSSGRLRNDSETTRSYVAALRRTLDTTRAAVEASGLRHNELWSYRIEGDTLRPVRYGTSSDIQLWNVTDLAVRFLLDTLPRR